MRFADTIEQAEIIDELRAEDAKNQMTAAALVGWQSGAGGKKTFGDYLKSLGLTDKGPKLTPEQKKRISKQAITKAEAIRRKDRKRRKKRK